MPVSALSKYSVEPLHCRLLNDRAATAEMKNGLYSVTAMGLDGVDWPPTGVVVLRDGVMLGGGPYSYYAGSYSSKDGIFKGELVLNLHTPPPSDHLFFNAENVGMGVTGT
jgi:hypothetical protein